MIAAIMVVAIIAGFSMQTVNHRGQQQMMTQEQAKQWIEGFHAVLTPKFDQVHKTSEKVYADYKQSPHYYIIWHDWNVEDPWKQEALIAAAAEVR
jgi:hypothetical protein